MTGEPTPTRRRGRPGYDRAAILRTAVDLFNRKGYDATSMGDLAKELGLTKPAIYHHFTNKEELLGEALDDALDEWKAKTDLPNEFVVPGGSRLGALLDVARSVVRRAERSLVAAGYAEGHPDALRAINRLSDLLFVLARNADGRYDLSRR